MTSTERYKLNRHFTTTAFRKNPNWLDFLIWLEDHDTLFHNTASNLAFNRLGIFLSKTDKGFREHTNPSQFLDRNFSYSNSMFDIPFVEEFNQYYRKIIELELNKNQYIEKYQFLFECYMKHPEQSYQNLKYASRK